MTLEQVLSNEMLLNGYKLSSLGINDMAFKRTDILVILNELKERNIAVLGGDVYCIENDCIKIMYDNWFLNRANECWDEYVKMSIEKALQYVTSYIEDEKQILYTLVIRENT